jgi:hypothetical protein
MKSERAALKDSVQAAREREATLQADAARLGSALASALTAKDDAVAVAAREREGALAAQRAGLEAAAVAAVEAERAAAHACGFAEAEGRAAVMLRDVQVSPPRPCSPFSAASLPTIPFVSL